MRPMSQQPTQSVMKTVTNVRPLIVDYERQWRISWMSGVVERDGSIGFEIQ